MTEKIKFKAANPPRIMKYDHFAHSAMYLRSLENLIHEDSEHSVHTIVLLG